jgi:hypothetical protein
MFMNWFRQLRQGPGGRTNPHRPTRLSLEALESRLVPYSVSGYSWPAPQLVTLSFVPDGTLISTNGTTPVYSNLFATFNARFGASWIWEDQILRAAQVWAQQANVNFAYVGDDGAAIGSGSYQQGDPYVGDIRIGGFAFGNSNVAQTYLPPSANNYSIAGDIQFNTAQTFSTNGSTYDLFTVAAHEFGHALGLYHSNLVNAEMYGAYNGAKSYLNNDDIAGIKAIYGARPAAGGNTTLQTATDLTGQLNPSTLTAQVNNVNLPTGVASYYYTVVAPWNTSGTLTLQLQTQGLSLLSPTVGVWNANWTTVLGYASGQWQYGTSLTVTVSGVTAGQRLNIQISPADSSAFGSGVFALTVGLGTSPLPAPWFPYTRTLNGNPITGGGGQAIQLSSEFPVNTFTNGTQQTSPTSPQAVAMDTNGDYVATWSSYGQDGSGWGVYAQRYNANGVALGNEFQVNTTTLGDQENPSVAMAANGSFVIVWQSNQQNGGSGWGIYGQRYDANGVAQGGEFQVNTFQGDEEDPTVAMDGAGNFVVTWSSNGQDGSGWGVYAQRFDLNGVALGNEFQVNTTTAGDQAYSTVAMNGTGSFVVTWSSYGQDGSGWGVYAQRYDANGVAQGGEFQVNTTTQGDQLYSTVALDANGNFVVTWSSNTADGSSWAIKAQRFDANGVAQGHEFQVNSRIGQQPANLVGGLLGSLGSALNSVNPVNEVIVPAAGDRIYSRVAMDAAGNFMITWSSYGQDGDGWGIYAQQYQPNGVTQGKEFVVNTTTAGDQHDSAIAMNGRGDAVVVWSGNGVGGINGVFGQRYLAGGENIGGTPVNDPLEATGDDNKGRTDTSGTPGQTADAGPERATSGVSSSVLLGPQVATLLSNAPSPTIVVAPAAVSPQGPSVALVFATPLSARGNEVTLETMASWSSAADRPVSEPADTAAPPRSPQAEEAPGQPFRRTESVITPAVSPETPVEATDGVQAPVLTPEQRCDACFADLAWATEASGLSEALPWAPAPSRPEAAEALTAVALGLLVSNRWQGRTAEFTRRKPLSERAEEWTPRSHA